MISNRCGNREEHHDEKHQRNRRSVEFGGAPRTAPAPVPRCHDGCGSASNTKRVISASTRRACVRASRRTFARVPLGSAATTQHGSSGCWVPDVAQHTDRGCVQHTDRGCVQQPAVAMPMAVVHGRCTCAREYAAMQEPPCPAYKVTIVCACSTCKTKIATIQMSK